MLLSGPLVTALLKRPIQSIAECTGHVPISLSGRKTYYVVRQCRYNSTSITDQYQSLLANDKLQPDHHQLEVVKRLQQLQDELKDYTPPGKQPYWINKVHMTCLQDWQLDHKLYTCTHQPNPRPYNTHVHMHQSNVPILAHTQHNIADSVPFCDGHEYH